MDCTLFYVHDPMCSWCWGFRPAWDALHAQLPRGVRVRRLVGGLAPDTDSPMSVEQRQAIQGYWRTIQAMLGTEFNFEFWSKNTPRRATYPACRAVIAARTLGGRGSATAPSGAVASSGDGEAAELAMIAAIQRAYYLQARNPADRDTLVALAGEIGLDPARFSAQLDSANTRELFAQERAQAQALGVQGFPSLVLSCMGRILHIPVDYRNAAAMRVPIVDFCERMAQAKRG